MSIQSYALPAQATQSSRTPAAHAAVATACAPILYIGHDDALLRSRAGVLRLTGFPVRSASPEEAILLASRERFSLVVFGHTLSNDETVELAAHFRRTSPQSRLLITCFDPRPDQIEQLFDARVKSTKGPAALAEAAAALLTR